MPCDKAPRFIVDFTRLPKKPLKELTAEDVPVGSEGIEDFVTARHPDGTIVMEWPKLFVLEEHRESERAQQLLEEHLPEGFLKTVVCPAFMRDKLDLPVLSIDGKPFYGAKGAKRFLKQRGYLDGRT